MPFISDLELIETSTTQAIKLVIVSTTGLSKDALHVYVGLAVLILTAIVLRKRLSSIVPWSIVLSIAIAGELLDMRDDIASMGYWRWGSRPARHPEHAFLANHVTGACTVRDPV